MKKETMNGVKGSLAQVALQGVFIPAIGTIVGFMVQKHLISMEQKKALKEAETTPKPDVIDFD